MGSATRASKLQVIQKFKYNKILDYNFYDGLLMLTMNILFYWSSFIKTIKKSKQ